MRDKRINSLKGWASYRITKSCQQDAGRWWLYYPSVNKNEQSSEKTGANWYHLRAGLWLHAVLLPHERLPTTAGACNGRAKGG